MFRIGFDTETGKFVVQVRWFFLSLIPCWKTVCQQYEGPAGAICCQRQFDTYRQARDWTEEIGLQSALSEWSPPWWKQAGDFPGSAEAQTGLS